MVVGRKQQQSSTWDPTKSPTAHRPPTLYNVRLYGHGERTYEIEEKALRPTLPPAAMEFATWAVPKLKHWHRYLKKYRDPDNSGFWCTYA